MTTRTTLSALFLGLGLACTGCIEELDPASLITGTRVLGAQVTVHGDPSRSTPAPGETVAVDWIVTAPGPVPSLSWGFVACNGSQHCALVAQGTDLPMRFDWTVPADWASASAQVMGQVCENGAVTFADGQPGCVPGATGTSISVDIVLASAGVANRIPDFAARPLSFDGAPWAPGACESAPTVPLGSKGHTLALVMLAEDRESYLAVDGDPPAPVTKRESLQISTFATAGELARTFSFVEESVTDAASALTVAWDAPEVMPPSGNIVQVTIVVRDMRGGLAAASRTICLE